MNLEDTIAAIATPIGESAIGIVRLSGEQACSIADQVYRGKTPLVHCPSHTIQYGHIVDPQTGDDIDEVLVMVMRAPRTFTTEDMIEINCHGGIYILRRVLEILLQHGARLAQPGEFTQRAFLNGRIDLTRAEAVADLIHAQTESALQSAIHQLEGQLAHEIETLQNEVISLLAMLEVSIDFSEEDIEFESAEQTQARLTHLQQHLDQLLATAEEGRIYREGITVAIVGKPNVGKSSLLNAFLQEERAIVSHIPGTTRDTIAETVDLEGVLTRLVDTAGIRETTDLIEQEGVRRSQKYIDQADMVLWVLDVTDNIDEADRTIWQQIQMKKKIIVVLNKVDQPHDKRPIHQYLQQISIQDENVCPISALQATGIAGLAHKIIRGVLDSPRSLTEHAVITRARHREALQRAKIALEHAQQSLQTGMPAELIAVDVNGALQAIGEIIGEVTSDDILGKIFSEFCIGK